MSNLKRTLGKQIFSSLKNVFSAPFGGSVCVGCLHIQPTQTRGGHALPPGDQVIISKTGNFPRCCPFLFTRRGILDRCARPLVVVLPFPSKREKRFFRLKLNPSRKEDFPSIQLISGARFTGSCCGPSPPCGLV